jgi:hypothetical protein
MADFDRNVDQEALLPKPTDQSYVNTGNKKGVLHLEVKNA